MAQEELLWGAHSGRPLPGMVAASSAESEAAQENEDSVGKLISVLSPALVIGLGLFLAFCFLRLRNRAIFSPRISILQRGEELPSLGDGFFSWIPAVMRIDEEFILQHVGLDAVVLIRFLRMFMWLFFLLSVLSFVIIVPTNSSGGKHLEGFDRISMSNIGQGSGRMWVHVVCMWLFSFIVMFALRRNSLEIVHLSQRYQKAGIHRYSALVSRIPEDSRSDEMLSRYFKDLYPDSFHSAVLVRSTARLDALVSTYKLAVKKLEHYQARSAATGKRPQIMDGCCWPFVCLAQHKDAMDMYTTKVQGLRLEIEEERKASHPCTDLGFVTFNSLEAAARASQVRHCVNGLSWNVETAPEARALCWPSFSITERQRTIIRPTLSKLLTGLLIIFFAVPVAFVQSLTNLSQLSKLIPGLKPLVEGNAPLKAFLEGFLPTLTLVILIALVPVFLRRLMHFRGLLSENRVADIVMEHFYLVLIVNVFFVTTLSGTVFDSLHEIIDQPTSILEFLGESLPENAVFFVNYIVLTAIYTFPVEIIRPVPLLMSWLRKALFLSETEKREALDPGRPYYELEYPYDLLICTIGFSYAVIAPIVLPFACIHFAMGYLVWRHQLVYVYDKSFESAGATWTRVFRYVCVGLAVGQLTLIGVVALKYGYREGPFLLPLPLVTFFFYKWHDDLYGRMLESGVLAMEVAREADKARPVAKVVEMLRSRDERGAGYMNPSLTCDLSNVTGSPVRAYYIDEEEYVFTSPRNVNTKRASSFPSLVAPMDYGSSAASTFPGGDGDEESKDEERGLTQSQ